MRIAAFIFFLLVLFSCRKAEPFTSSKEVLLHASEDTLHFDTVFTSAGSVTQIVKIFNDNEKGIHIGSVTLKGGAASPFRINVSGQAGPRVDNIDLAGEDSAYIFVTVKIDPTAANLPFVVRDSIELSYNGNASYIQLEAFGRNAHFFRHKVISANESWKNDLPYVILGGLEVGEGANLTINEGCRVYMHADAPLIVKGSLQVSGKQWDSTRVVFAGDRLDLPYRNYPAGWPGIYFINSSTNNVLEYADIQNAYQGIVAQASGAGSQPQLQLRQVVIDNAYDAGLIASNTAITAQNLLLSNCGKGLMLVNGGNYLFEQTTVAGYSNSFILHNNPSLVVSDYLDQSTPGHGLQAVFRNCIFWGDGGLVKEEVAAYRKGGVAYQVQFDHVLWKLTKLPANVTAAAVLNNLDPQFVKVDASKNQYDFHLQSGSPAINKGVASSVSIDLEGAPRPVGLPDLGCYERQ